MGAVRSRPPNLCSRIGRLRGDTRLIEINPRRRGRANLEDQRYFEHQRAVAGEGGRVGIARLRRFGAPAALIDAHASTSSSSAAKVSTSSAVVVSVTATTRPFARLSSAG